MFGIFGGNNIDAKGAELRAKAKQGDLQGVMAIAKEFRDSMDTTDKSDGWTALMICAATGKLDIVKWLVMNGADVNLRDPINGWTAVMCAGAKSRMDIAVWLAQNGADIYIRNNSGKNVLDIIRDPAKKKLLSEAVGMQSPMGNNPISSAMNGAGMNPANNMNGSMNYMNMNGVMNNMNMNGAMNGSVNGFHNMPSPNTNKASLQGVTAAQLLAHKLAARKQAQHQAQQVAQARAQAKAQAQAHLTVNGRSPIPSPSPNGMAVNGGMNGAMNGNGHNGMAVNGSMNGAMNGNGSDGMANNGSMNGSMDGSPMPSSSNRFGAPPVADMENPLFNHNAKMDEQRRKLAEAVNRSNGDVPPMVLLQQQQNRTMTPQLGDSKGEVMSKLQEYAQSKRMNTPDPKSLPPATPTMEAQSPLAGLQTLGANLAAERRTRLSDLLTGDSNSTNRSISNPSSTPTPSSNLHVSFQSTPGAPTTADKEYATQRARAEAESLAQQATKKRESDRKARDDHLTEKEVRGSVQNWIASIRQGHGHVEPPALHHVGIPVDHVVATSPMSTARSPPGPAAKGTLDELRGDVKVLTDMVNVQKKDLDTCKATIDDQQHIISRLTEELHGILDKQQKLNEESEKLRMKELNAISIIEDRIEELRATSQSSLEAMVSHMQDTINERLHDQISNTAVDQANARDEMETRLNTKLEELQKAMTEQIEHHKQMFDHIVSAL